MSSNRCSSVTLEKQAHDPLTTDLSPFPTPAPLFGVLFSVAMRASPRRARLHTRHIALSYHRAPNKRGDFLGAAVPLH